MHPALRKLLRPAYRALTGNAVIRRVVDRAIAARDTDAILARRRAQAFVEGNAGSAYGVTREQRAALVQAFENITRNVESGTAAVVHTVLAEAVLSIPPDVEGVVVECGAWKGASAAALSHACALVNRKLVICDSFEGLPDDGGDRHVGLHTGVYGHYEAGMFAGTEAEVGETLKRYGKPDTCEFLTGFFAESLKDWDRPVAFAFLDVDLAASTRDALRALWPHLVEGGYVYSDDAGDLDVVKVFFNDPWWRENLDCPAPGFVGSGCGLPLRASYSAIGYTRKLTHFDPADWRRVPFLVYPESDAR
jgi:hypothetical protein